VPDETLANLPDEDLSKFVSNTDKLYRSLVARQVRKYEQLIGLQEANPDFRAAVEQAVSTCLFQHSIDAWRKRPAVVRKEILRVKEEASSSVQYLGRLRNAIEALVPAYREELLEKAWGLRGDIAFRQLPGLLSWLEKVSAITDLHAECFIDRGGAPKMQAFRALAEGLARAFERATGKKARVTWNEHRSCYEGRFLKLVDAVLQLVLEAAEVSGRPLKHPKTRLALGKYLHELTRGTRPQRR
jgi:hypothetical protein